MSFEKNLFRQKCKKKLFNVKAKRAKERIVDKRVTEVIKVVGARNILAFIAMKHEPKLRELFAKRGKWNIYVPFMQATSFRMVKFRLPLQKKKFAIYEPLNSFLTSRIDLAIIPVIGVDGDFRRVGFGKGMYDRFFASLSYRPVIVFVQITKCITKQIVTDSYDVQGDILITPKEIFIRGDSDVGRAIGRKLSSNRQWRCRLLDGKKMGKREI